jgi:glycosyltransferase involved in cell wall biosynthesis
VRVLVLTTVLPGRRRSGGEIVSQAIVDALRRAGFDPRVIGYVRPGDKPQAGIAEVCAGARPIETKGAGIRSAAWMAKAVVRRLPYSVAKYSSRAYVRAVERELEEGPSAVLIDHAQIHFARDRVAGAPLIYVAHNVETRVYEELVSASSTALGRWVYRREARLIGPVELDLLDRAAETWALTDADREVLQERDQRAEIRVLEVPSGFEALPVGAAAAQVDKPAYDVALIGTWTWQPNRRGLRWFVAEVVPRLPATCRIAVAGAGAGWLEGHARNIEVRGLVDDGRSFLARAGVVAVPATTGGGVQVKTLDAIASGVPVVTTSTGVRGLRALPSSVAVEDDADRFAASIIELARAPDRGALRDEATAWSRERRTRFERMVAERLSDLAGSAGAPADRQATTTR